MIYQTTDGAWILAKNGTKRTYATAMEASMVNQKELFAQQLQQAATQLAQVADKYADLFTVFFDRGYDAAGANPIVDEDVAALGITAADIAAGITLAENLTKFLNNEDPFNSDYDRTLNDLRTDI